MSIPLPTTISAQPRAPVVGVRLCSNRVFSPLSVAFLQSVKHRHAAAQPRLQHLLLRLGSGSSCSCVCTDPLAKAQSAVRL